MSFHHKTQVLGLRALLSTALLFAATSVSAVTVDGDINDLITVVGTVGLDNIASGVDPMGSADSPTTESNNGFDIKNVYAYYDQVTDIFYLGMSVYGTIGDSQAITNTTSTSESITGTNCSTFCDRADFDSNETYGIRLYFGTADTDPLLLSFNVVGQNDTAPNVNNDPHTLTILSNTYGLGISYVVGETNNGVEYSISGLHASGAMPSFSYANPADLLIRFTAGSTDTNTVANKAEDAHDLQMQVVPVPASVWLLGSGMAGLVGFARRRRG